MAGRQGCVWAGGGGLLFLLKKFYFFQKFWTFSLLGFGQGGGVGGKGGGGTFLRGGLYTRLSA